MIARKPQPSDEFNDLVKPAMNRVNRTLDLLEKRLTPEEFDAFLGLFADAVFAKYRQHHGRLS